MQAVIMAGGKGTRLASLHADLPKPLVPICGVPMVERSVSSLVEQGINDIVLVVGYKADAIRRHFGDGSSFGARVRYVEEDEPLGTAGAFPMVAELVTGRFALVFGDLFFDVDWAEFERFHEFHGAKATLFAHPNSHPYDSDLLDVEENGRVSAVLPKTREPGGWHHNLVNAGLYILEPSVLGEVSKPVKTDFERDVLAKLVAAGEASAYRSVEYVKDAGTPERLMQVEHDIEMGLPASRRYSHPKRCVFLDRDGTVNELRGFISDPCQIELIPDAAKAIRRVNESGALCVLVTNQPVVARGECTFEGLECINAKLENDLGADGAFVDAIYVCPHHPDSGFAGEVPELKHDCGCRKPKTGLIDAAVHDLGINTAESWMVGDSTADILAGARAGLRTVLVATGEAGLDGKYEAQADFFAPSLLEAVDFILSGEQDE